MGNLKRKSLILARVRETKGAEKLRYLRQIIPLIDLTNVQSSATEKDIERLCRIARKHKTAAVCVNPAHVEIARRILQDTSVKVAAVAGGFPLGQIPLERKLAEIECVKMMGTDEVDVVINQGAILSGDIDAVRREFREMRSTAGLMTMKVILETGALKESSRIRLATQIAIEEGANFIKTSTGFSREGASFETVEIILKAIREAGGRIGIKPSGGVKTIADALMYMFLVEQMAGREWITPSLFRYGASSLLRELVQETRRLEREMSES